MISEATQQLLEKLHRVQNTYQPAPAITAQLSAKTLLMFVGATCVGKNTVMQSLAQGDPRFGIAGTFTSRPARDDDNLKTYTYYEHSDEGLEPILERIAERQVLQYAINPHSLFVYGSEVKDYGAAFNLADVFSGAVEGFQQLGFKQTMAFTIITQPDVWLRRFETRFPLGHPQRAARRDEAIDSFGWSLAQTDPEHFWVENVDGQPGLAAETIKAIALGQSQGQPDARALAEACLKAARSITI